MRDPIAQVKLCCSQNQISDLGVCLALPRAEAQLRGGPGVPASFTSRLEEISPSFPSALPVCWGWGDGTLGSCLRTGVCSVQPCVLLDAAPVTFIRR